MLCREIGQIFRRITSATPQAIPNGGIKIDMRSVVPAAIRSAAATANPQGEMAAVGKRHEVVRFSCESTWNVPHGLTLCAASTTALVPGSRP
jgi:hypothetical protein